MGARGLVLMVWLVLAAQSLRADNPAATAPVLLPLAPLSIEGVSQPNDPAGTSVMIRNNGAADIKLPIIANTWLWKESADSRGAGASLVMRDARWSQALIKIDPEAASGERPAFLHLKIGGVERKGLPATFLVHRMLKDWSEDANWFKPFPDQEEAWNGLKPGVDFEAKPLASLEVAALTDGQIVEIPGMEAAVKAWHDGTWENHGFLLVMNGKALQCGVASRAHDQDSHALVLGGSQAGQMIIEPNLPLLHHVMLKTSDLLDAGITVTAQKPAKGNTAGTIKLEVFRALRPLADRPLQAGTDYDPQPLGSAQVTLPLAAATEVKLPGLADILRQALDGSSPTVQLLVRATEAQPETLALTITGSRGKGSPVLAVAVQAYPHAVLFENDVKPQPGVYATFRDGHIYYGDKRLRLWGVVGAPHADRLIKMGFNAERIWEPRAGISKTTPSFYSAESIIKGEPVTYTKGDGSLLDTWDKHIADDKAHGIFVMLASVQGSMPPQPLADDNSFIAPAQDKSFDAADWNDWKTAVTSKPDDSRHWQLVDERLTAIRLRSAKNILTHVNPYTGKAWGQEENITVYEDFNENGFGRVALEGGTQKWPAYFQAKFKKRWNDWLKAHYADDAALFAAWGKLNEGESVEHGTVNPAPTLAERATYPAARTADYVHFTIDLVNRFQQDFRAYCRTLAPPGVGVAVAPFSFDTQYRPSLPWNYTNSRSEVNSFGMYFWDLNSSLTRPPSAYVIDSNTVEGAATILYETNCARPDKYRTEYPLKAVAMAGWQDWDGLFWHYWSPNDEPDESYLTTPMPYETVEHYWSGVQHQNDPVMDSAMAIAGRMFLQYDIHPATKPVIAEVGGKALYGYDAYNGVSIAQQTFAHGARIRFAPAKPTEITFDGQPPAPAQRITGAVASGDEILWDWPNGRLIIDTPNAKAYVGKFSAPFKFKDGIVLGDVSTPFVSFAMVSADGKPIIGPDAAQRIYITAMADAQNSGFKFNWNVQGGPLEIAKAIANRGHAPVLVDQVKYHVWFPTALEAHFRQYDFALRQMADQTISGGNQLAQDIATPFMAMLTIDRRLGPAAVPDAAGATIASAPVETINPTGPDAVKTPAARTEVWSPIAVIGWDMDYHAIHRTVRDSTLVMSSISREDLTNAADKTITLSDAQLAALWNTPADVLISFHDDHMKSIDVTFKQPPPFAQAVTDLEKQFGTATEKQTGAQFERSLARWNKAGNGLTVTLTESQGILKALFEKP